jgi:hypothetical protein
VTDRDVVVEALQAYVDNVTTKFDPDAPFHRTLAQRRRDLARQLLHDVRAGDVQIVRSVGADL